MKRIVPIILILLVSLPACRKKDPVDEPKKIPVVSQFVYDGMSAYYLWADEMTNKKPTTSTNDPKAYFETLLSSVDKQHEWSWITDDVDALLAGFSGSPKDFGWSLALYSVSGSATDVVGIVKYVFPNTPAANAGIVRGEIINKIDGATMTQSNYTRLFDGNTINVGVVNPVSSISRSVSVTPILINTNPVLKDTVYKDQPEFASKKIGYLFYTGFISDYNNKLQETFLKFKAAGITDLVIDLRYNHGGAVSSAAYLASLLAPYSVVQDPSLVFTELSYNSFLNSQINNRNFRFVSSGSPNPLDANVNMSTVYIIATDDSYSAAELLTYCLKPYMNVVHIGNNTGGKFTGSFTVHAFDNKGGEAVPIYNAADVSDADKVTLKNWAMQPIVAIYKDKNGNDFSTPGYLAPTYTMDVTGVEGNPAIWRPIGDVRDYMLAKAISLITGIPVQGVINPDNGTSTARSVYGSNRTKLFSDKEKRMMNSVQLQPPSQKVQNGIRLQLKKELTNSF